MAQRSASRGAASRIFHSGYSAEDRKNIGKITKFITPAKFSSCLMKDDSISPSAPSISPPTSSAGMTAMKPKAGMRTPQSAAMARKMPTCKTDTSVPASSLHISNHQRGSGAVSKSRIEPISRS